MPTPTTKQDFLALINEVIKDNGSTDTSKLQGARHRALWASLVTFLFDTIVAPQETGKFDYDWTVPSSRFGGYTNPETTFLPGFYKFMHPDTPPKAALSVNDPLREPGSSTFSTLTYTAVVGSQPLTSLVVDGQSKPLTPLTGTQLATSTGATTTFTMTVTAAVGQTAVAQATVRYRSKMFIFTSTQVLGALSDDDLSAAMQASATGTFTDSRALTRVVNPNGEYIYIAYVTDHGGAPLIKTNQIQDTSFVRHQFDYRNEVNELEAFYLFSGDNLLTGQYTVEVQ